MEIDEVVPWQDFRPRLGAAWRRPAGQRLAQAGAIATLFEDFGELARRGYLAMSGQIIDASIVPVLKQRNSRDGNAGIKQGEMPEGWKDRPAKRCQKDTDALDREARQEPLRLQDPRQPGPPSQAGAALLGDQRGGARQPGRG